ncbi:DNA-binding transcriptional LysR family regulator [Altererythrobacter atlanticus]|uniref:HTH-type transcriptional regulator CynR n=1 Tax=Croceibacterium atlanticum TaxID=1267766 RepID=A0A0F7KN33_9SPHN|nr:LysR family transcriptional regulator [Croceibacterium atlanticum]AKH41943.1 HTH-type transcriptional regulator CynR [Croceibacterium atlanticum]MBB5733490.1 DNA-binding transcriptional LysR family regulator [Croceibacterium atlanticum]
MRLRHIEIFHAVYLNGSVSAAARALNISQPAVTKTLKHAEQTLGFPLFDRRGGRLVPTEDAHTIFKEVADIQNRVSSLRQATRNMRRGSGSLRVSVLPSLALDILPRAVAKFSQNHPDVFFDLQTLHHEEIGRALFEREVDIVIAYKAPRDLPVISRWLGEGELGLLYRREELKDEPGRVSLKTVADRRFISLAQSGPIGDLLRQELGRDDTELNEVVSARTFFIASALVREGIGMAVLDNFTAMAAVDERVGFKPLQPTLAFDVFAMTLEKRPFSHSASEFLDIFRNCLEEA